MTRNRALVIDNGIGATDVFVDDQYWQFERATTGPRFAPRLQDYDLLIVPNGADHLAMLGLRDAVRSFLDAGHALFCFCGWFTDWIPGHRWVHDNSQPTRDVRHFPLHDPYHLLNGVDLSLLDRNQHGISGWWACGQIFTSWPDTVLIRDTWHRALVIADDRSTPGFLFLTASGPLSDDSSGPDSEPLRKLYRNALQHVTHRIQARQIEGAGKEVR